MTLILLALLGPGIRGFGATFLVPQLPGDNLLKNPWFRNSSNTRPGLDHWVTDGHWGATDKDGNPTPDNVLGTCARISTGRGEDSTGQTVLPGVDTYLSQVVTADPAMRRLKFDMYWVTHTLNPGEVRIYGGSSAEGPWLEVWKPFYEVHLTVVRPPSGLGQDLWAYYSDMTDLVTTSLTNGFPYYKLEIHGNLPDENGGFKLTGVYFAAEAEPTRPVRFESITRTGDGVELGFVAVAGRTYSIEYREDCTTGPWLTLTNLPSQAATGTVVVTDSSVQGQRFYRLLTPGPNP